MNLRKIRYGLELSQSELAELIHVRKATISDIENGKTKPSPLVLFIIQLIESKILTIDILKRFKGKQNENS
jgi:transcriptional regulator with XRE-family HTH domain